MVETIQLYLAHPLVQGIVTGILSAAAIDVAAFRQWKSWNEFQTYSWSLASFRMFQGAVVGFLAAAGIAGLT